MKYYTKRHVCFFMALAAALGISAALAISERVRGAAAPRESAAAAARDARGTHIEEEAALLQNPATHVLRLDAAELQPYTIDEKTNIAVYDLLNEAVVNITTETQAFNWFLEPVPQNGDSGSGSIIDTRGHVLTNYHLIQNATKIYINLADGSQHEGKLVGADNENDLAVLQFSPPKGVELKTIPYGDSRNLKVGQKVLAIGNPFAFERTLTVGIVSGLGRPIQTSRQNIIRDMIQTDASINPGNSGGPLLDTAGKMIGINTMIYTPSGGSVGIGFAVPVDTAKRVVAEILKHGKVRRGWIDGTLVQLFPRLVQYAELPVENGLLVSRTRRGGLAEKAGLRQGSDAVRYGNRTIYLGGDIIVEVDGMKIDKLADLYSALEDNKPGDKVAVVVVRNGKPLTLNITLADREETIN